MDNVECSCNNGNSSSETKCLLSVAVNLCKNIIQANTIANY